MGDVSYRPLIEDMTWSHSRIKSFEQCPYFWFMRYICGEEEQPMFYASYGSFVHKLIERYYLGELKKEELPLSFLLGFSEQVQGKRPSDGIVEKYIKAGKAYFDSFEPFPFEPLAVEQRLDFDVEGKPFTAIVDFRGTRDGKIAIVDNKSRDLVPRSGRGGKPTAKDRELDIMLEQLYLYAHGVHSLTGEFPAWLCFNCFKNRQFIVEPFDRDAYERVLDKTACAIEEIEGEEDFRPNLEYFYCKYLCGLHDVCCYYDAKG